MSADAPRRWYTSPEMLVGLSAVVLSLCGIFIALYEASLMRQEARAAAWPHAAVTASINPGTFRIWVQNNGVGPARVHDAILTYEGEAVPTWDALIRRLGGDLEEVGYYQSMIGGRVLPAQSEREEIFRVRTEDGGGPAAVAADAVTRAFVEGEADLTLCFCSVYEDCWTASLHDMLRRWQGEPDVPLARGTEACPAGTGSGI